MTPPAEVLRRPTGVSAWQIISTPPMTGADNMGYDLNTLISVQDGHPPVLRFFRWDRPAVSYGKHQALEKIHALIPPGLDTVQRPTGGGLVVHGKDLCLSLCWRQGQPPLPIRLKDHYAWIHRVIAEALRPWTVARLANCKDCSGSTSSFDTRLCFNEPVVYDVLRGPEKIAGGALCRRGNIFLYQGSIQEITRADFESHLVSVFQHSLSSMKLPDV